jgi:hypothetical protein
LKSEEIIKISGSSFNPDSEIGNCDMPTILRIRSFRFHFYSDEGNEPPHIHVEMPDGECKFWLEPVRLARNKGVPPLALRQIEKLVFEHRKLLTEKYNDFQKQRE